MGGGGKRRRTRRALGHRVGHGLPEGRRRRSHAGQRQARQGGWGLPGADLCRPCRGLDPRHHGGWAAGSRAAERHQADRGDRRHRLPAEGQLHAGLQRSREMAVRDRRPAGRGAPSGPGDPCRRLSLPRNCLPRHKAGLRRKPVRRQLGGLAEGLLRSRGAAARVGAVGHGARQSRTMQPRRAWLVPSARSASECRQMHGHDTALRLAHRFAEPAAVRWRRRR